MSDAYQQTNNAHYCYDIGHFFILFKKGEVELNLDEAIRKRYLHNRYLQCGKKRWLTIFIPLLLMANSAGWTFTKQDIGMTIDDFLLQNKAYWVDLLHKEWQCKQEREWKMSFDTMADPNIYVNSRFVELESFHEHLESLQFEEIFQDNDTVNYYLLASQPFEDDTDVNMSNDPN